MTDVVKTFIENNIDEIDSGNWVNVFSSWYEDYAIMDDVTEDSLKIREFFNILQDADIPDVENKSLTARKEILVHCCENYIEKMKLTGESDVRLVGFIVSLKSRLLFGLISLKTIFGETCDKQGLKPLSSLRTVFEL